MFIKYNQIINIFYNFYTTLDDFTNGIKSGFSYYIIFFILNALMRTQVKLEVLIYVVLMVFMYNKMKNHHISLMREITTNKMKTDELINYIIDMQEIMDDIEIKIKKIQDEDSINISEISEESNNCDHKWVKKCFGYDDYWYVCQICGEEEC